MRRTVSLSLAWLALACSSPTPSTPQPEREAKTSSAAPAPAPASETAPETAKDAPKLVPWPAEAPVVRTDLVAEDLPPIPALDSLTPGPGRSGELRCPEGRDELAVRAAVSVGGGLLLAGQAYLDRKPGSPSQSWRWLGFVPATGEPRSTTFESGAIRAARRDAEGGALLVGTGGIGFDARGWFGVVDREAEFELERTLDSEGSTELLDLLPGAVDGELALAAGYTDAHAWVVSLDAAGAPRWHELIGSYGYTQIRAIARRDDPGHGLLAVGTRAERLGESWWATIPGHGSTPVVQDKLEIEGADAHQMLRALVELGPAGFIALGTAKRNHIQAHDQVIAVGFDRSATPTWSRVVPELRAKEIYAGRAHTEASAQFVVGLPGPTPEAPPALALVEVSADSARAHQLDDSSGWRSAGFIDGHEPAALVGYARTETGIAWRELIVPGSEPGND